MITPLVRLYNKGINIRSVAAAAHVPEHVAADVLAGRVPCGYEHSDAVARAAAFFCGCTENEMRDSVALAGALSAPSVRRPHRRDSL